MAARERRLIRILAATKAVCGSGERKNVQSARLERPTITLATTNAFSGAVRRPRSQGSAPTANHTHADTGETFRRTSKMSAIRRHPFRRAPRGVRGT